MKHVAPFETKSAAPLERKSAVPDDPNAEVKVALEALTKTTTEAIEKLGKEVKSVADWADEIELKAGRLAVGSATGRTLGHEVAIEHKALSTFVRGGDDTEIKSLSVGSDPDGGYIVLPVMSSGMTKRLFDQSPMRRVSRVETITVGDAFEEIIDKDDVGATWVGEKQSRPATTTAQLGKWRVPVEEIYALQPVTQRLLDDANRDVGGWVDGKITDKFGRSEGTAFASGDGILKPKGFLTYPTASTTDLVRAFGTLQYTPSGAAADFAASNPADPLRTLMWSLRAVYRQGATWMMNSNTASRIDKFKNGTGDYIWRDGMTAGAPPSMLGYPVEINEDMSDVDTDTFPIAFGNFKLGYCIVEKAGIRFLRDPFTDKPNVLFYAYKRVGGGLTNSDAI